jgi:hypothetical protein
MNKQILPRKRILKKDEESFELDFWGLKFNAINPGKKTISVLIIFLLFLILLFFVFKIYILPFLAFNKSKNIVLVMLKKIIK